MAFGTTGRRKNRSGFRGKGEYKNNTGINDWSHFPDALARVVERFEGVCIECRPAVEIIQQQDGPHTLFYCDPPYPHDTRSSVQWNSANDRAYAHEMTDDDHRELSAVLHSIKGMAVVSGYHCDLYDKELYADWTMFEKDHNADGAVKRVEVLWLNAAAVRNKSQAGLFEQGQD
jgi:DNA adenine methylase